MTGTVMFDEDLDYYSAFMILMFIVLLFQSAFLLKKLSLLSIHVFKQTVLLLINYA